MFKIFKKKDDYYNNESIRPWVIEQYKKLKLAQFSHDEIISTLSLNVKEKELLEKQNDIFGEVINMIDKAVNEEPVKEVKENNEVIDAEIVKETVVEEDPSKWTDEEVIEKALHELTNNMEYQDKEQMSDLLRESFNSDKGLVDIYRNKYIAHYKLVNNNILNNDNKSTENKEEGGEKEIKSEVIESRKEESKKVEPIAEDNKIDDLNIDNEMFEMLVDDVYDQYKMIFNIKKDKLKDLIRKVLQEKPEILKSTNYYFVCMRICEIIENLIMENTIEDNEEDELLNQLNSIVE